MKKLIEFKDKLWFDYIQYIMHFYTMGGERCKLAIDIAPLFSDGEGLRRVGFNYLRRILR